MPEPRELQGLVRDMAARLKERGLSVAVVGDINLDTTIEGCPGGRHPEIGIPVLREATRHESIGGAANIALALGRLGIGVACFGVVGSDLAGRQLESMLDRQPFRHYLVQAKSWPTPRKDWIYEKVGDRTELVQRIDFGRSLAADFRLELVGEFRARSPAKLDVIVLVDHGLGTIGKESIALIEMARGHGVKVVAIPRTRVLGTQPLDAIVINKAEMRGLVKEAEGDPCALAARYAREYAQHVFLTMLSEGICVCPAGAAAGTVIPDYGYPSETPHWMGARDMAAAIIAVGLALEMDPVETGRLANAFRHLIASQRGNGRVTWRDIHQFVGLSQEA
jgi:bifunctional ADP-heptose synthase (sugar kinase/adenylyltransferase)